MSHKAVRTLLNELRDENVLVRVGSNRGGYWKVQSD